MFQLFAKLVGLQYRRSDDRKRINLSRRARWVVEVLEERDLMTSLPGPQTAAQPPVALVSPASKPLTPPGECTSFAFALALPVAALFSEAQGKASTPPTDQPSQYSSPLVIDLILSEAKSEAAAEPTDCPVAAAVALPVALLFSEASRESSTPSTSEPAPNSLPLPFDGFYYDVDSDSDSYNDGSTPQWAVIGLEASVENNSHLPITDAVKSRLAQVFEVKK